MNRDLTPSTRRLLTPDSLVDLRTGEEAINRGLAKRLDQLANERERREKAARAEDENFSVEFLSAARKVFEMIDVDESGTLEKEEVVVAIRGNKKVINFLVNCGNKNLQYLLVPARLDAAMTCLWLTGRCSAQGGVHRDRAQKQTRGPSGQALARCRAGREGDRGIYERVQKRRARVLPDDRHRRRRLAQYG